MYWPGTEMRQSQDDVLLMGRVAHIIATALWVVTGFPVPLMLQTVVEGKHLDESKQLLKPA